MAKMAVPRVSRRRLCIALVTIAVAGCAHGAGSAASRARIAGEWQFNEGESQQPNPAGQGQRGGGGGAGGVIDGGRGAPGARGGRGGGLGRGSGPQRAIDPARMRAVMNLLAQSRSRLRIVQTDSAVTLAWGDVAAPEPIRTDGKGRKGTLAGLGEIETKAKWEDGQLVVEQKFDDGIRIRREFTRGPSSPRLMIVTKVSGLSPGELEFKSVYDVVGEPGG